MEVRMAWWQIVLIIIAAVALLFILFANFEVAVILIPKSKLSKLLAWGPEPPPATPAQKVCRENRDAIIAKAKAWDEATPHTDNIIKTYDGLTLYATEYLQPKPSHKWVLIAHGFHAPLKEPSEYGMYYYEKGYNVLTAENRAHGRSDGKYITMGWLDRLDYIQRINDIVARDPEARIVLHGVSMGGATVMMVTGEKLPKNVVCAIEDCGYTSVWDEFTAQAKNVLHMPAYPIVPLCSLVSRIRCGYSFKAASSIKQVKKSVTPTLFIHGGNDTFVPTAMVYRNYGAASCPRDILIVKDAEHAMAKNQDPDLYWGKVFEFISKYEK
jgi:fermentation-respiration switch protein FrsA (DUF1100 family)